MHTGGLRDMMGYGHRAWNVHGRATRYDGVWTQGMECTQEGFSRYDRVWTQGIKCTQEGYGI
jgi:hypothetical protein